MILSIFSGSYVQGASRRIGEFHPIIALFGSAKLDLRGASFDEGPNNLSALALFGSVEIWVPEDVGVYVEGLSAFGGREVFGQRDGGILALGDFESPNYRTASRRLNVTAIAGFAGVTVKRALPPAAPANLGDG